MLDELGQRPARRADDGGPGGHGLGDDEAERLVPGDRKEEGAGAAHQSEDLVVGQGREVPHALAVDVRADLLLVERRAVGEVRRHVADDDERQPRALGDRDGAVGALVRHEAADRDQEVAGRRTEGDALDVDAVRDDRQAAAEHAVLRLGDADGMEVRAVRAVVVVEGLLDVRVGHDARARRSRPRSTPRASASASGGRRSGPPARRPRRRCAPRTRARGSEVTSGSSWVARGTTACSARRRPRIARGEEGDVVAARDEPPRQTVDRDLGAAMGARRNGEADRRDLRDPHGERRTAPAFASRSKYSATAGRGTGA